jgi:hypothetical protein
MNVEIWAQAALFPEQEYIHKWDFLCSVVRDFSLFLYVISRKNAMFRIIRYLVDAVLGDDEVSVDGDGRDEKFRIYVTLWTLFLVMMRFLSMAMAVMEKEDMKTPRLGRVFTSLEKGRVACDDFFYISSILGCMMKYVEVGLRYLFLGHNRTELFYYLDSIAALAKRKCDFIFSLSRFQMIITEEH